MLDWQKIEYDVQGRYIDTEYEERRKFRNRLKDYIAEFWDS